MLSSRLQRQNLTCWLIFGTTRKQKNIVAYDVEHHPSELTWCSIYTFLARTAQIVFSLTTASRENHRHRTENAVREVILAGDGPSPLLVRGATYAGIGAKTELVIVHNATHTGRVATADFLGARGELFVSID